MKKYYNIYLCVLFLILCLKYSSCHRRWLEEGASCVDGPSNGTCLSIHVCKTKYPQRPIHSYIKCSVRRRVKIVCCPHGHDENPTAVYYNAEEPIIDPLTRESLVKTGQKAWDKCLDYLKDVNYPCKAVTRLNHVSSKFDSIWGKVSKKKKTNTTISGGQNARPTQFPHMALLGYGDERKSISWMCGGSLISDKFILTAAHCISDVALGPVKYAALGVLRRTDVPTIAQQHTVQNIIPHPDYHSPIKYNDIALLETARRVVFGPTVVPACLAIPRPPQRTSSMRQQACVTGWGFLGRNKKLADTLQVVYLNQFNYNDCSKLYPVHRHMPHGYNTTTQVCYGDKEQPKDTCQGDSGGPLQIPGQASDCQYSIIAVTSYGISCPSEAGMYTRIYPYLAWIESVVWP